MPNWCSTSYVIEGDAKEVKNLYELMADLQERKEPSVPNGFGTTWLGCLVNALGGDWKEIRCRGEWSDLEMDDGILKFTTETAWGPCDETFMLVCRKFPTLRYFYQSEEPGMAEYWTNDTESKYFTDKYIADLCTPDDKWYKEYFSKKEDMFKWFKEISGHNVKSVEEILAVTEKWDSQNPDAFCNIYEFSVSD
ncbi:hypothetical protein [uncultured Bacteroides sp.]|uniref:hypothetical protein n=1 Tax=uncultured Bacteroides sp. TaxID=162156 RepID=UPI000EA136B1|nr:hypothetical protein [uncultured Bacteroides sp.]